MTPVTAELASVALAIVFDVAVGVLVGLAVLGVLGVWTTETDIRRQRARLREWAHRDNLPPVRHPYPLTYDLRRGMALQDMATGRLSMEQVQALVDDRTIGVEEFKLYCAARAADEAEAG